MSFAPRPDALPKLCPHCGMVFSVASLGRCPTCGGDVASPPKGPPILEGLSQGAARVLGGLIGAPDGRKK
jgi:hypothetical protein